MGAGECALAQRGFWYPMEISQGRRDQCFRAVAVCNLGNEPRDGCARGWPRSSIKGVEEQRGTRGRAADARIYGTAARDSDSEDCCGSRIHWVLHKLEA